VSVDRHRNGRWLATIAGGSLVISGLGMAGATASAEPMGSWESQAPDKKISEEVETELAAKGSTDFWIHFGDRPEMDKFRSIADLDERRQAVYDELTSTAAASQKGIRAQLDSADVEYQTFWATNAIKVSNGDMTLVNQVAASSEVAGIYPSFEVEAPDPEQGKDPVFTPYAVEWGVSDINADDVWSQYGITGEGIVVGSIDTGAQWDHPALVNQYRGNNGDGTFTHDYNWFDAAGTSPDEPFDGNGHGSHVTGTMVGTDGGENQIGVAPGATWIAANGCCPSDAALVASGEWMLAPTDLEGNNPDPTKAPDVVNNSWGTQVPSNEPFMEEISEDWAAAGIFGVFANGNNGPGCNTSGSPGSRIINYSVGNYNSGHTISATSSRGAGQDGAIKPDIAAPGSAIRSSVPGNGYALYSGTSMASPHVAGAVALVWSAAPSLVGDIEGTRALLDGTALDTEDLQCGGTAEHNNVFGEGRLDALALIEGAPVGDTGTLTGVVTDTETGEPIDGAQVSITGPIERNLVTNDEGAYNALLTAGEYTVEVEAFGYLGDSATVQVVAEETVTQNFALQASAAATVSGTVTDGSGQGWPLYAAVRAEGSPVLTYTDPETGAFDLELPSGTTYTLVIEPQYPGYETVNEEVTVSGDTTVDVAVPVDALACNAPGYGFSVDGVTETFDGTEAPEGWTVEDNLGNEQVWRFDDHGSRGNLTGGEGGFAIINSDAYGSGQQQDSSLVSPSVDMSALTSPVVGFKTDINHLGGELFDVDVSLDGGATWENVVSWEEDRRGPREEVLPLPTAAGQADVQVRFHYHVGSYDWWWQVDDVFLGNRTCDPQVEGGIVVGNVYDANTDEGIVGATVTDLASEQSVATSATPADENLDDGFYWMFEEAGERSLEASARNYESKTQDVSLPAGDAVRADFTLGAGHIEVAPGQIQTSMSLGQSRNALLTLTNTGSGAAEVQLGEVAGDFTILRADGSQDTMSEAMESEGAPMQRLEGPVSFAQHAGRFDASAEQTNRGVTEDPWTDLSSYPKVLMDGRVVNVDGEWYSIGGGSGSASYADVYRYDNATTSWVAVAPLPSPRGAVTAGVIDGQIIVSGGWVSSGTTGETLVYDPAADTWTQVADNPSAVSAAGQAVLDGKLYSVGGCTTSACTPMGSAVTAYDPGTDSWEQLADYPAPVAFASCGGVGGEIVCTGGNGGAAGTADSYAYDPASDTWSPIADAPIDTWASQYAVANDMLIVNGGVQGGAVANGTFAWDGDAWQTLPNSNTAVYRGGAACGYAKVGGSSGGFNATADTEYLPGFDECGSAGTDVTWLSLNKTEVTVPANGFVRVRVTTDGDVPQPGTYTAGIRVRTNTPQSIDTIPVTMTVHAPAAWGKLMGTVTGQACDGSTAGLPGATVDITPTNGDHPGWVLGTAEDGTFAQWFHAQTAGKVQVIAAKDGYRPKVGNAHVKRSQIATLDFTLPKTGC
jgi:subtilisin family serine protease